ncbi:MAG: PH domain-containing protein [Candidatus Liptonbacteria bacterium]|nr:PH domain-containing protein [Candidatus Liptonbacteria bacterium]
MRELDKVLDANEKVFWEGTPSFWPFLLGGSIITTIFGLFWMVFLIPFIAVAVYDIIFGSHIFGFGILLLPHFWVGVVLVIGIPIYQILLFKHVRYAITDKRVILQKGVIGRDFEVVDFDQITNAEVNVGLFDKLCGGKNTGSILISTAGSFTYVRRGAVPKPYTMRNIENPYEVFKFVKKVSHDVKTDIQYPNKLRPNENPGYGTNYDPNAK